jgi:hypothetical protein
MLPVIIRFSDTSLSICADGVDWRPLTSTVNALAQIVCIGIRVVVTLAFLGFKAFDILVQEVTVLVVMNPHVAGLILVIALAFAGRRWPFLAWMAAWRLLVVQVEMGRAARIITFPTVPCADRMFTLMGHILICMLMSGLILHTSRSATVVAFFLITPLMFTPISIEVDILANVVALVIHLFTILVVAIVGAAFFEQCCIVGLFQENIHKAFNLLRGGPINLSILLKTFLGLLSSLVISLASTPTLVVSVLAIQVVTTLILTICGLALRLLAITLSIFLDINFV